MFIIARVLGYLSGILFVIEGIVGLIIAFKNGRARVSDEERAADHALAEQVWKESLERGDMAYMAEFYRADTLDLTEQENRWVMWGALLYAALRLPLGIALVYAWWRLLEWLL